SYLVALSFFDVRRPLTVATHGVDTKADDLTVPRCKAWFELGHIAQFGGANGSKVFRMREQNGPPIANPFMKVDLTLRGLSGEIRCLVVDTQLHLVPLLVDELYPKRFQPGVSYLPIGIGPSPRTVFGGRHSLL